MLVPKPGFPLYKVVIEALGGFVKEYPLKPDLDWQCDTIIMESLIDSKTRAIIITNPSNPCGSNFSPSHLNDIVLVARKYNLPIIADEIYGGCVFGDKAYFTPISCVSNDVLILSLGGIAKEFVVPGKDIYIYLRIHKCICTCIYKYIHRYKSLCIHE
jgi:tyrosine aminotransferase